MTSIANFFKTTRIYFLIENRENAEDPSFAKNLKIQRLANEKIIQSLYRPGDVILVEDSAAKDSQLLRRDQLPTLDARKFQVRGWYSQVACESRSSLEESLNNIQTKLDAARMPFFMMNVEKRIEAYKCLHDYASQFPLPECVQANGSLINKEDLLKLAKDEIYHEARDILFKCCELFIEQSKLKHMEETFPLHQASLKKVPVEVLQEGANTVFVIMGKDFQEPTLTKKFPYSSKVVNEKTSLDNGFKIVQEFFSSFACDVR